MTFRVCDSGPQLHVVPESQFKVSCPYMALAHLDRNRTTNLQQLGGEVLYASRSAYYRGHVDCRVGRRTPRVASRLDQLREAGDRKLQPSPL